MKAPLHACVHVAEFAAQVLLRVRPMEKGTAVAVLDGPAHDERICALNRPARQLGAVHELTRLDAESLRELHLLRRSEQVEEAARVVMLETALQFTPRVEEVFAEGACALVLDMTGTERLFGAADTMAAQLRSAFAAVGMLATVAVSANFHVSRMLARARAGVTIVVAGDEAQALSRMPIDALDLDEAAYATFALWGIHTLGELAALPEDELITR
jgi:protein ImuB